MSLGWGWGAFLKEPYAPMCLPHPAAFSICGAGSSSLKEPTLSPLAPLPLTEDQRVSGRGGDRKGNSIRAGGAESEP